MEKIRSRFDGARIVLGEMTSGREPIVRLSKQASFRFLRRILLPAAGCVLLALLLRWGVIAGYTVPTASMEPVLRGDPGRGDKVAVFKLQYRLFQPKRYDLVVFRREGPFPKAPGVQETGDALFFVKRLVGLPGETLLIKKGDLFLGETPREPLRKPLEAILSTRIPVYRWEPGASLRSAWQGDWWDGARGFRVEEEGLIADPGPSAGAGPVTLTYAPARKAVFDDYIDLDGNLHEGRRPVRDLILEIEVSFLSGTGGVTVVLREEGDRFRFLLRARGAGGGGEVLSTVAGLERSVIPPGRFPGFSAGKVYRVAFMNVDDRLLLIVDGARVFEAPYAANSAILNPAPENVPSIRVEGGRVRIQSIGIFRDIHYTSDMGRWAVEHPFTVPEGCYFFLGDNSAESLDSRFFGAVPARDLVGRPFLVFYPFSRFRFL